MAGGTAKRWTLAVLLAGVALSKVVSRDGSLGMAHLEPPYRIALMMEGMAIAMLLATRHWRLVALATACAFLGAGIARLVLELAGGDVPQCQCLGDSVRGKGPVFIMLGVAIGVSWWVAHESERAV